MNLHVLKCPECNSNLEIEEGCTSCYCRFCGCKIILSDDTKGATFNKSIHIIKDISYTTRHIDEANVIRAKSEASKDSRDFKQLIILLGIMLLIPVAMLLGLTLNKFIADSEGKINAGYYRDLIGEDYESVAAHFEAAGFTNIELIDLEDSGIAFWTNGKVEMISIGGNTDFETTDWFSPDTKVVISYH